ncbi:hypothetical protein ZWY2020_012034 [Hordeum vulgare]|nr:hypothetical protein ZWY2020_012034 [Hordeum vulgare]
MARVAPARRKSGTDHVPPFVLSLANLRRVGPAPRHPDATSRAHDERPCNADPHPSLLVHTATHAKHTGCLDASASPRVRPAPPLVSPPCAVAHGRRRRMSMRRCPLADHESARYVEDGISAQ